MDGEFGLPDALDQGALVETAPGFTFAAKWSA